MRRATSISMSQALPGEGSTMFGSSKDVPKTLWIHGNRINGYSDYYSPAEGSLQRCRNTGRKIRKTKTKLGALTVQLISFTIGQNKLKDVSVNFVSLLRFILPCTMLCCYNVIFPVCLIALSIVKSLLVFNPANIY